MSAQITFYPVGNGDMTLLELEGSVNILIDCNIRGKADNDNDDSARDVATDLRGALYRDDEGRLYVDAMVLSHPDADHCAGLRNHFHMGSPDTWVEADDKIVIREMWSSPTVFRRATKEGFTLTEDAKSWATEARRRVKRFRDGYAQSDGHRICILGEDEDGKTDDLGAILVKVGETITSVNGNSSAAVTARLIGPIPDSEVGEEDEDTFTKNNSSIILNFSIEADGDFEACKFLTGGDAEVAIWNAVWGREKDNDDVLDYDVLQVPHHCSWRSISFDSWSKSDDPQVDEDAFSALSQARPGAKIISSSNTIEDNKNDPPCIGAKEAYQGIDNCSDFYCTEEYPDEDDTKPLIIEITDEGTSLRQKIAAVVIGSTGVGATTSTKRDHGRR